jgi:hypothetical protein
LFAKHLGATPSQVVADKNQANTATDPPGCLMPRCSRVHWRLFERPAEWTAQVLAFLKGC